VRAEVRNARIALTAATLAATSVTTIAVSLLVVPIALGYLGAERYGLWLSVTSVMALLRFADFGIGNGLLNTLARAHGQSDLDAGRRYISSGFILLSGFGLLAFSIFALLYPFIDWGNAFAVKSTVARNEAAPAILVLMACIAANIPIGAIQRLQAAHQSEYVANVWTILGTLVGLVATVVCAAVRAPLPWLIFSATGTLVVTGFANGVYEFAKRSPELVPRIRYFSRQHASELFQVGILFVLIQLTGILLVGCDNLIISHILGPERVPEYAVPLRLYQIAPILVAFVLKPAWPAYAEARARGDAVWIRATFRRSVWLTLGTSTLIGAILVVIGPSIIVTWVGTDEIGVPHRSLMVALAVWSVLASLGGAYAMFLNGMDVIRFQAVAGITTGVVAIVAKLILTSRTGVSGVVWGMNFAQAFFFLLPSTIVIRRRLSETLESQRP
jgi:O-antigen/teichoic acid export membrane protein